ncbi:MBL fold metallo-hydrolase [Halobacillus sp. ACCC02827]|uniref:MBL fold metallo-hydrolase n=1 Tax=Halobacillus sp. ACCC02827 TaxID=3052090 RepID=UPI002570C3D3|nr:MBL fold metallo-hydrolase [Halobacillus sp. ACCC02827]WJE14306.1 MBL fold metallo-hydrolase [Halobacillus sp. ACCC02827]
MRTLKDTISQITLPTPYAVGDVHIYLLKGDRLSLVDAGVKTEEAWTVLKERLKELGYAPEDIEQVILTHHHPDHMGLIERFPKLDSIIAHPKLKPWLEREEEYLQRYERFFKAMYIESGVPERFLPMLKGLRKSLKWSARGTLTGTLQEGDTLPGHDNWKALETPGHAQSHLSFLREADGAFIGGDLLLSHISSNPLLEPGFCDGDPRPRPLLQYRESLERLLDLPITSIYPGHGKIFDGHVPLIKERLEKQEKRARKVKEMVREVPLTAYEVCERLFPKQVESQLGLTMSESIGQLDYLEHHGDVKTQVTEGRKRYVVEE